MPEPVLVTIHELCARYSLKLWTIRQYCAQGRIPHVKVGRKVLFRLEDIERWLAEQTQQVKWPLGVTAPRYPQA